MQIEKGSAFILYDDDDYNGDDSQISPGQFTRWEVDGDSEEPIVRFNNMLSLIQASDAPADNIYAAAFIRPECDWSEQVGYNQNNLTFVLNVASEQGLENAINILNQNRQSKDYENSNFWIAYFLISYQGDIVRDADPATDGSHAGLAITLAGSNPPCDCLVSSSNQNDSPTCPAVVPQPASCVSVPTGAFGGFLYYESQKDTERTFLINGESIENIPIAAPHELGHQFGLNGDAVRTTFYIMDYSAWPTPNALVLHPEHLNLIRKRVNSPGQ